MAGSAKDTYVAARSRLLSMRQYFPEHDAVAGEAYANSKPTVYNKRRVKIVEGTLEVLEVEAVDWRPAENTQ